MAQDHVIITENEVKFNASAFKKFVRNIARRLRDEFGGTRTDRDIEIEIDKVIDFTEKLDAGGVIEENTTYDTLSSFITIETLQNWTDTFFNKQELQVDFFHENNEHHTPIFVFQIPVELAGIFQQYLQSIWGAGNKCHKNNAKRQHRLNLWCIKFGASNGSCNCKKFRYCATFNVRSTRQ